jgi:hypothetical protein
MRRVLLLLTLAALLGAALPAAAQPPTAAVPDTVQETLSHCKIMEVTHYLTGAGNLYTVNANVCLAQVDGSPNYFAPHVRFSGYRNEAPWDGFRFDTTLAIRYRCQGCSLWITDNVSEAWHYPASGWMQTAAHTGQYVEFDLADWDVKGTQNWGAKVRILLGDGTTTLQDMIIADSVIWL